MEEDEYVNIRPHTKNTIENVGELLNRYNYEVVDLAIAALLEDASEELADQYRTENDLAELKELLNQEK